MLPIELIESFRHGDIVLFLGAGLSIGAGLPGWAGLVRPLAQSIGARWPADEADLTTDRLLTIAQHYANQRGRFALVSHLQRALDGRSLEPTPAQRLIALLPVATIFTTNYDDLAERALRQANKSTNVIVEEPELAFWREDRVQVVKLCGDLARPTSIVVTQRDFSNYFATHPRFAERLRATFESKTALFIGYSLRDPFVNQIWDNIGLYFGETRRWGSVVVFDAETLELEDLKRRGVYPINLKSDGGSKSQVLEVWLTELVQALSGPLPIGSCTKSVGQEEATAQGLVHGTGNKWAVLVGADHYDDKMNYGDLHVCVKDVHAIRQRLVEGGFDPLRIRTLTDDISELPTRENVLATLKSVADSAEQDDLILFYYSGHGDESNNDSYLVARNGRRLVLSDTAIPVSRITQILQLSPARAKVIILDACHSGADTGGKGPKPMSPEFIRHVFEQAEGLAVLASCKQGQLSYEWRVRERSVFTHFLLEALTGLADRDEKGFVTVQDANRFVVHNTKLWASQNGVSQTPTLQYTVAGDISLCTYTSSPSLDK